MDIFSPDSLFQISSFIVTPVWALMIFFPRSGIHKYITRIYFIPLVLSVVYLILIVFNTSINDLDFSSIAKVRLLFEKPYALLAGWIHYLAFDLLAGSWIIEDAQKRGINHFWIIAPLVFTFVLGPIGFLLYYLLRIFKR